MSTQIQAIGGSMVAAPAIDTPRALPAMAAAATAAAPVYVSTTAAAQNLQQALQEIARYLQQNQTDLKFRVDDGSGRVIVSIVDPEDGTVIRQIPSEEALRIADLLARTARGLVDERA